jgi:pimeloyl-ACP methyl ester carboxylesterase
MPAIEIEGRRFAWSSVGSGPRLVLLNGYAATGVDWDPFFLHALARAFEVICPDNRGMGASELGSGELTVEAMAADVEALLDALELPAAPVVGWSMGGFVAQRLAARSPGRVSALALLATDPGGPEAVLPSSECWQRLCDHSDEPRQQATRLIELLFPPAVAAQVDRDFGEQVADARAALSAKAAQAQEAAIEAWHAGPPPSLGDRPPTLVAHGREDQVIPAANAELLGARWRAAEVQVLEGCGHALMAQEPQRLARALVAHCRA